MVDALMFADAEHEANDLDSHGDLWRCADFQRHSARAASGTEPSGNAEPATAAPAASAGVPSVPVSLRPGTLIENAGRLNAIQQLIGRLHGTSELRDSLELLRSHFLDQSSGMASSDLLDDYDMLRRALDSVPASGSGASEPPTPQQSNLPSDEPLPPDTDDGLLSAILELQRSAAAENAQSSEGQQTNAPASDQTVKSEQTQPTSQSAMTDCTTEPPTATAEDGFLLPDTLELGKLSVQYSFLTLFLYFVFVFLYTVHTVQRV